MSTPSTRSLQRVGVHPCLLAALIAQAFVAAPAFANVDLAEGKRIFESVCATCHGARGQPDTSSPVVQALEAMPADLSDPLFNSREPAGDWEMVVRHGGHALGLSAAMPAQGDVLSDAQVESVVAYVKTLADTTGYPPGELNLMLPVRTKKAFPEDEFVLKTRWTVTEGKNPLRNVVEFEKRVGARGQTILEVVHEDSAEGSGVEEIEVGYKHALTWSAARQDLLSGAVVLALPSDADGSEELIPYLAYARILSPQWTLQSSGRLILPFDDVDRGEFEWAGIVHYVWSDWPRRVFPALEVTATVPFEDDGGDDVQFTVLPQIRIGLTRGGHVALNIGVELPLSDQEYDYRGHLTLLWDFADGSFFQGW